MTDRRPLVDINGQTQELPLGDALLGAAGMKLIAQRRLTVSGNYTPSTGAVLVLFQLVSGGNAGDAGVATTGGLGGIGGATGYVERQFVPVADLQVPCAYTIGAGGLGSTSRPGVQGGGTSITLSSTGTLFSNPALNNVAPSTAHNFELGLYRNSRGAAAASAAVALASRSAALGPGAGGSSSAYTSGASVAGGSGAKPVSKPRLGPDLLGVGNGGAAQAAGGNGAPGAFGEFGEGGGGGGSNHQAAGGRGGNGGFPGGGGGAGGNGVTLGQGGDGGNGCIDVWEFG